MLNFPLDYDLNIELMTNFAEKCKFLDSLSMSFMTLNDNSMKALIDMFKKILKTKAPLTYLELRNFSEKDSEGIEIINALIASKRRRFEQILLNDLAGWSNDVTLDSKAYN